MNHPSTIEANLFPLQPKARLGSLLVETGRLSDSDVERIVHLQQQQPMLFGTAAKQLGLANDTDIQQALARQFDYPYVRQGANRYPAELVIAHRPFGDEAKRLRALRGRLALRWMAFDRKSLAVVGADRGVGTSILTANLAVSFAQLGKRVLLVDGNLQHPRQHAMFGFDNGAGLSDILAGRAGFDVASLIADFDSLVVLPSGTIPPNPTELLSRHMLHDLLQRVLPQFDVVLFDLPAFTEDQGALEAAVVLDGALVVAHRHHTRLAHTESAESLLAQACVELVGVVLMDH